MEVEEKRVEVLNLSGFEVVLVMRGKSFFIVIPKSLKFHDIVGPV